MVGMGKVRRCESLISFCLLNSKKKITCVHGMRVKVNLMTVTTLPLPFLMFKLIQTINLKCDLAIERPAMFLNIFISI